MGTVVELMVTGGTDADGTAADAAAVSTIRELEAVFSVYDEDSELCRWRAGTLTDVSPSLADLLGQARSWQERSHGRFNPLVGELTELWRRAEVEGVEPSRSVLAAAAAAIGEPRFTVVDGRPVLHGDGRHFTLNAIAKGYIVDRALAAAVAAAPVTAVCVNAGGDLAHRGHGPVRVGIENPHRPYDNEPPLVTVGLENAALATSGRARRGFRVGGRWFGHVIDPRSGRPVDTVASITVSAPDAVTADVVATAAGVAAAPEAVRLLEEIPGVEGLVVPADGGPLPTSGWAHLVVSGS
ncbi:MAG: FAD:protein FMN transferase [Acidimicrobiales bacterium]